MTIDLTTRQRSTAGLSQQQSRSALQQMKSDDVLVVPGNVKITLSDSRSGRAAPVAALDPAERQADAGAARYSVPAFPLGYHAEPRSQPPAAPARQPPIAFRFPPLR